MRKSRSKTGRKPGRRPGRRPDNRRMSSLALSLALVLAVAGACSKPATSSDERNLESSEAAGTESGSGNSWRSEDQKTRELQDRAADLKSRYDEIRASDATDEEKAKEVNQLFDEQQATVREAEDGSAGGESGDSE